MMNIRYSNGEIYGNGTLLASVKNDEIYVYLHNNKDFSAKVSLANSFIEDGYHPYIKLTRNYCLLIFNYNQQISRRITEVEHKYEAYVTKLLRRYRTQFYIEITKSGKVKAIDDVIEIVIGKEKDNNIIIKLDEIYNEFIKEAVLNFIQEIEDQYAISIEEDKIIIYFEDAILDRIEELF